MAITTDQFAEQIKVKYPQYAGIDNHTLATKMVEKYPEYKSQVNFGLSGGQKAGAFGVGAAQGVSEVGQNIVGKPVGMAAQGLGNFVQRNFPGVQQAVQHGAEGLFGKQAVQEFQQSEEAKRAQPGYNPAQSNIITEGGLLNPEQQQSGAASLGREVGKFIGTTALAAPVGGGFLGASKNLGKLGRLGTILAGGATEAQVGALGSEGRLATPTETAIGAGTAGLFGGIARKLAGGKFATKGKLEGLVQPKMTPGEEEFRAAQGLKKTNIFGNVSILSTKQEQQMAKVGAEFLNPNKTVVHNINKAIQVEADEANKLRQLVKDNPYTFNTKTVASEFNKIETPLSIKGDKVMESKFNNVKQAFIDIWNKQPTKNAEGLLDSRKQFDALVKREFPNLYTSDTLTPIKSAVIALRRVPNELINSKIGGDLVKKSLSKQSNIMGIIENLSTKSEQGGTTAISRFVKNNQGKLKAAGWTTAAIATLLGLKKAGGGAENFTSQ